MTDREELIYRCARALDHSRTAVETQEAADQGHSTPEAAAALHWDTASQIASLITRLQTLHDVHVFDAKRMERAQREENRSGREYRAGGEAA